MEALGQFFVLLALLADLARLAQHHSLGDAFAVELHKSVAAFAELIDALGVGLRAWTRVAAAAGISENFCVRLGRRQKVKHDWGFVSVPLR